MAERILITNARVLSCAGDTGERPFDGDVLIEGERIAGVSQGRMGIDPGSARVVDVRGATVLPGLGDAHTHISWPLDFVFDHGAVAAAPPAAHALDVAAVTKTYIESGYTTIIGAGTTQPHDDLLAKAAGYGMRAQRVDGMDVFAVEATAAEAAGFIRNERRPCLLEARTYRFRAHSMYDPQLYRSKAEVKEWEDRGPLITYTRRLKDMRLMVEEDFLQLQRAAIAEVSDAAQFAEDAPVEPVEDLYRFVYAEPR